MFELHLMTFCTEYERQRSVIDKKTTSVKYKQWCADNQNSTQHTAVGVGWRGKGRGRVKKMVNRFLIESPVYIYIYQV